MLTWLIGMKVWWYVLPFDRDRKIPTDPSKRDVQRPLTSPNIWSRIEQSPLDWNMLHIHTYFQATLTPQTFPTNKCLSVYRTRKYSNTTGDIGGAGFGAPDIIPGLCCGLFWSIFCLSIGSFLFWHCVVRLFSTYMSLNVTVVSLVSSLF